MVQGYPIHINPNNSIQLKCDKCHRIYILPADMYYSMLNQVDQTGLVKYITLDCVYCEKGTMTPIEVINRK